MTTATEPMLALADRLATVYATFRGAEEIFAPDALIDINVPTWRFQVQGPDAFFDWLREYSTDGYGIRVVRAAATPTGFVVEVEGEYTPHGEDLSFRNLILCEVWGGRITEMVFYCTGDWGAQTRARWLADAPMVRR